MMDGRVKTLHPKIHGGLLALRDNPEHVAAMARHGIGPIDLVCINLYPFEQTIRKPGVTFEEAIENIDIGGPSMIRSAAKNHRFVARRHLAGPYEKVLGDLRQHGGSSCGTAPAEAGTEGVRPHGPVRRADRKLPGRAEQRPPASDPPAPLPDDALAPELNIRVHRKQTSALRRKPAPEGGLYVDRRPAEASVAFATQLHGKELSYINLLDADAALSAVKELGRPGGLHRQARHALRLRDRRTICRPHSATPSQAIPLAAFGGIVALNQPVDLATAMAITSIDKLLEVIVAPAYAPTRWNC